MAEGSDIWTIRAALEWTQGYLDRKGDENPRLSAEWLLAEACSMRRVELYVNFERPLSPEEREVLRGFVARRGRGEPLQYITGEVGFRHIAVKVRPGVLIPRPETEVLVSEALSLLPAPARRRATDSLSEEELAALVAQAAAEEAPNEAAEANALGETPGEVADSTPFCESVSRETSVRVESEHDSVEETLLVADLCTGTGCIACSIAYEHPAARVVATDLSPEAVALARENAAALGLEERVRVLECDLAAKIGPAFDGRFDLVVSNPPYVPASVLAEMPREVTAFEPVLALDGGADGNDVLRRILPEAMRLLKPGGALALELHETRLDAAAGLARSAGFSDIRIIPDLANRPRVLTCRK